MRKDRAGRHFRQIGEHMPDDSLPQLRGEFVQDGLVDFRRGREVPGFGALGKEQRFDLPGHLFDEPAFGFQFGGEGFAVRHGISRPGSGEAPGHVGDFVEKTSVRLGEGDFVDQLQFKASCGCFGHSKSFQEAQIGGNDNSIHPIIGIVCRPAAALRENRRNYLFHPGS